MQCFTLLNQKGQGEGKVQQDLLVKEQSFRIPEQIGNGCQRTAPVQIGTAFVKV